METHGLDGRTRRAGNSAAKPDSPANQSEDERQMSLSLESSSLHLCRESECLHITTLVHARTFNNSLGRDCQTELSLSSLAPIFSAA